MAKRGAFKKLEPIQKPLLKLDFGCGPNPREGFEGVDQYPFGGKVTHIVDVSSRWAESEYGAAQLIGSHIGAFKPWPWADGSVAEAHASHFIEHLTSSERVHFCNELYRILVPGGTCQVIVPHWASCRAYGDPTHQWPPVSEFWFYYLSREWRMGDPQKGIPGNAPHTDISVNPEGFACHFAAGWGYSLRGDLSVRAPEWQQFAIQNYKEVCQDIICTLTKA